MHRTSLGRRGYGIRKDRMSAREQEEVRRDLVFRPAAGPVSYGPAPEFPVYRESNTKMYVPRLYGWQHHGAPSACTLSPGDDISLSFAGTLRSAQKDAADIFLRRTGQSTSGAGLLELYCGFGKTVVALWLAATLGKKTLVVVHKDFLLSQWTERIHQFLPGASVGRIQGQVFDVDGHDIVIAMLQSLALKDYPRDMCDSFGFAIIDECHHMSAEVFSNALFKVVTPRMLGLSATMTRKDGLSKVFKLFLGDIVVRKQREGRPVEVRVQRFASDDAAFLAVDHDYRGTVNYSSLLSKVHDFPERQKFVRDLVRRVVAEEAESDSPRQMLLLAQNKSLLHYLMAELVEDPQLTVGYYLGGMKQQALKEAERCRVILATYAMAEEALDIRGLTTLVLATPRTSVAQAVGRIMRSDGHLPVVYDIVDPHGILLRQWKKRKAYYAKAKYRIRGCESSSAPPDDTVLPGECLV
jgi:superfamily II DNA or RNA helicase